MELYVSDELLCTSQEYKQRFINYILNTLGNCEGSLEAATNEYEAMSEVYEDNTYGNPELDAEEVLSYWE